MITSLSVIASWSSLLQIITASENKLSREIFYRSRCRMMVWICQSRPSRKGGRGRCGTGFHREPYQSTYGPRMEVGGHD